MNDKRTFITYCKNCGNPIACDYNTRIYLCCNACQTEYESKHKKFTRQPYVKKTSHDLQIILNNKAIKTLTRNIETIKNKIDKDQKEYDIAFNRLKDILSEEILLKDELKKLEFRLPLYKHELELQIKKLNTRKEKLLTPISNSGSCCEILESHHEKLKDDPDRLSTDFIKTLSKCECRDSVD